MLKTKKVKLSKEVSVEILFKKNSKEIANLTILKNGCSVGTFFVGATEMKKTIKLTP